MLVLVAAIDSLDIHVYKFTGSLTRNEVVNTLRISVNAYYLNTVIFGVL